MTAKYRTKRTLNKKKYTRKRRNRALIVISVVGVVLLALAGAGVVWGKTIAKYVPFLSRPEKGPAYTVPKERVTFLVLGLDEKDPARRADMLTVVTYDPAKPDINVISIPKNTLVEIPGSTSAEIGQAFTVGRVSLSMATVEYLLGVDLDHYVEVDKAGLKTIIDKLGGVTVNSKRMSGDAAVRYVSPTSATEKESDRIEREQKLLAAVHKRAQAKSIYDKLASLAKTLKKSVGTDFAANDVEDLPLAMGAVQSGKVRFHTIPGNEVTVNGKVFFQPNKEKIEALIQQIFGADLARKARQSSFRIRVLNGIGTPAVATEVSKKLVDSGYRVIDTKNADSFNYTETQLIIYSNKASDLAMVNRVKTLLGVGKVVINNLPQDVADLTIVIGADYQKANYVPQKKVEVLNGSGVAGVAATAASKLTSAGFTVVKTENADRSDYAKTKIVLYIDNDAVRKEADQVKSILGVGEISVSTSGRTDVEITVIVGSDYKGG